VAFPSRPGAHRPVVPGGRPGWSPSERRRLRWRSHELSGAASASNTWFAASPSGINNRTGSRVNVAASARRGSELDGDAGRLRDRSPRRSPPAPHSSQDPDGPVRLVASGGRGEYRSAHGNGSRPRVPSMRGAGSRCAEVRRGAATTRNVPAVSRGTCARCRRRGQRVEGRAAYAAIRRRAWWGRLVAGANTWSDHPCRISRRRGVSTAASVRWLLLGVGARS
jgi:hypothetical protein